MPSLHGWNKMHKIARKQHDWVRTDKRERQIENCIISGLLSMSPQIVPDVWDRFQCFLQWYEIVCEIHLYHSLDIFLFSLSYRLYIELNERVHGIFQIFILILYSFYLVVYPTFLLLQFWIWGEGKLLH